MSHFSTVKTELRDFDALCAALSDLGHPPQTEVRRVRGHRGQTMEAQLSIPQTNGSDIGFRWNGKSYELVTDLQLWCQNVPVERFLTRLSQRYALHAILATTQDEGFEVVEQTQAVDGSIQLVVTRWNS